jgi:hypothetical protein
MFDAADKAAAELAQRIKTMKGDLTDGDSESREKA